MFSIRNGQIIISGTDDGNVEEMFSYFKPNFPGIRIEDEEGAKVIVGVYNPAIITALMRSPFYNAEEPMRPFCV